MSPLSTAAQMNRYVFSHSELFGMLGLNGPQNRGPLTTE